MSLKRIEEFETRFQKFELWKSNLATEVRVAGAIHAWHHQKRFLTGLAWDLLAAAALLHPSGNPKSVLMLGVAGGTALRTLRHLLPDVELTGVDLDRELIDIARKEMRLSDHGTEIHIADAYQWLRNQHGKYDVVIDDLYLAGADDVYRSVSCDCKWIDAMMAALHPGGILAMNLVTGSGHRSKQSSTRERLRARFPVVRSLSSPETMNEVLVAGLQVATASRLTSFDPAFRDWRDRMFWRRIRVRK